jgi:uncharacterized membrane protein YphA (DoxX/SURF4 family)
MRRDLPIDLISRSPIAHWAPVPLRLIVGYGFMEHGFAKLARGLDAFPAILHALGVPAPHLMGWLTILAEIFGGLAVLLGALVPLASIPMAAVLLVAMTTVHLPYGFSSIKLQAVTAAGAQFGPPGFEPTSFTSRTLRPSCWGARDRWRSTAFWQSAAPVYESAAESQYHALPGVRGKGMASRTISLIPGASTSIAATLLPSSFTRM